MKIGLLFSLFFTSSMVFAAKLDVASLVAATKKYAAAKSIRMDVKKELDIPILNKKRTYKGKLFLEGPNKIRLELNGASSSVAYVNKDKVWVVELPAEGSGEKERATKLSLTDKNQNQMWITSLLKRGELLKNFVVTSSKVSGDSEKFSLKSTNNKYEVKDLKISVRKSDSVITALSYKDELNSKVSFEFTDIQFDKNFSEDLFTYKPPKGAEVSEM